jgi:hypothetical protein
MRRLLDVARIQLINPLLALGMPLGLLVLVFALNLGIFAAIGDVAPPGGQITGAMASIYIAVLILHLQTMTQFFPFLLGLGVTRRQFYAGTTIFVVGQAMVFGLVLMVGRALEIATGGWGMNLVFFRFGLPEQSNVFTQWLGYVVPFLVFSAIGLFAGVVFKRWGQIGVYAVSLGTAVILAVAAVVITLQGAWFSVGRFFVDLPPLALGAGYPLLLALLIGGAGWLTVRRAVP